MSVRVCERVCLWVGVFEYVLFTSVDHCANWLTDGNTSAAATKKRRTRARERVSAWFRTYIASTALECVCVRDSFGIGTSHHASTLHPRPSTFHFPTILTSTNPPDSTFSLFHFSTLFHFLTFPLYSTFPRPTLPTFHRSIFPRYSTFQVPICPFFHVTPNSTFPRHTRYTG